MRPEVDSEYVLYRTPRGRQNATVRRASCDECGRPLDAHDPVLQGADPEALSFSADPELIPMKCHRCSVAGLMKPSY